MISNARANPPREIFAKSGSTWAFCALVTKGSVTGVAGKWPRIDGSVVEVVVGPPGTEAVAGGAWATVPVAALYGLPTVPVGAL
jgi:hypothetical protein